MTTVLPLPSSIFSRGIFMGWGAPKLTNAHLYSHFGFKFSIDLFSSCVDRSLGGTRELISAQMMITKVGLSARCVEKVFKR
jgi:hypothetical protein